jgi:hypothetical protein
MNCGSAISDDCAGKTFLIEGYVNSDGKAISIENRFLLLVSEVVSIGTFLITQFMANATTSLTVNQIKGVNALRCAFLNGFTNVYLLLAAAYYAARQFDQEAQIQTYLNEYYPYLCTCEEDVENLAKYFGDGDTANFANCGEE